MPATDGRTPSSACPPRTAHEGQARLGVVEGVRDGPGLATKGRPDDQALRHPVDHPLRRRPAADGNVLPLPGSLRGGAATKVVGALLARGLIREHVIDSPRKADAALNTDLAQPARTDGRGVLLFITAAGAEAIGIEPAAVPYAFNAGTNSAGEPAAGAPTGADEAPVEVRPEATGPAAEGGAHGRGHRRSAQDPRAAPSRRS